MSKRKKSANAGITETQRVALRDNDHAVTVVLDGPAYMAAVALESLEDGSMNCWENFDPVRCDAAAGLYLKRLLREKLDGFEQIRVIEQVRRETDQDEAEIRATLRRSKRSR